MLYFYRKITAAIKKYTCISERTIARYIYGELRLRYRSVAYAFATLFLYVFYYRNRGSYNERETTRNRVFYSSNQEINTFVFILIFCLFFVWFILQ